MVDFKTLKSNRGQKSIEALNAEMEKLNTSYSNNDERYWKPTRDKAGNGFAIIRFCPAPAGETVPYVRRWDHGFQGPGGWYIEDSLTTIGKEDPVSKYNSALWNTKDEAKQEIARSQKRRESFTSNIYVITDSGNPENEGKNFLYKYGKKIWEKIEDKMHPAPETKEEAVNPFDFWEGANFKIKIKTIKEKDNSYPNYDMSAFDSVKPLFDDDDKLEELYNKLYSLQELVNPANFKSYEELEAKMNKVLGLSEKSSREEFKEISPNKHKERESVKSPEIDIDNDDDMKSFFAKLKEE